MDVNNMTVYSDPALLQNKGVVLFDRTSKDPIAFDASKFAVTAKDLSMYSVDGTSSILRSTANSYVVRTPGTYKFPVVYGNGIKNGVANVAAYTNLGGGNQADFVNHRGALITSPFIEKNANCQPASAGLLWQTSAGMIQTVNLVEGGDCKYIQFTVASIPATNGDALLVVRDSSGTIMWSWLIWCTSDVLGPDVFKNYTNVEYLLMTENLGAIWNEARTRQWNPHFQWGRKDPMAPVAGSGSQATLYDINGNVYSGYGVRGTDLDQLETKTVAEAIKNPNLFFTRYDDVSHNWNNLTRFNNFWNAALNADGLADDQEAAIKTIYDPCPVGYMLPSGRAFTGFSTTGNNTTDATQFNVIGSWDAGWKFKRSADDAQGNYFPASGYRANGSGGLTHMGGSGNYWSYASNSQANARRLNFNSGALYPLNGYYRSYGFSVRPSRELN